MQEYVTNKVLCPTENKKTASKDIYLAFVS